MPVEQAVAEQGEVRVVVVDADLVGDDPRERTDGGEEVVGRHKAGGLVR